MNKFIFPLRLQLRCSFRSTSCSASLTYLHYISLACNFSESIRYKLKSIKKHDMRRTEILCPNCMKEKVITSNEVNANCDQCGEEFILTGKNSLRYKKPSDLSEEQRAKSND